MKFWDMLYKRYSNPMTLLSQMLRTGQLTTFINNMVEITNKETLDEVKWEFWLHKVFDKSWDEYLAMTKEPDEVGTISEERKVIIVKKSLDILERQKES